MLIGEPGQEANRDTFLIFFNMKVCCLFSLDLPDQGEYTQYTIFSMKNENHPELF